MFVGRMLRALRVYSGLKLTELADQLSISENWLYKIESGEAKTDPLVAEQIISALTPHIENFFEDVKLVNLLVDRVKRNDQAQNEGG